MDTHAPPADAGSPEAHRPDGDNDREETDVDADAVRDPAVSGPHAGHDRYGRFDYRYWRCEACGLETTQDISDGCPRCARVARGPDDGSTGAAAHPDGNTEADNA